MQSAPDMYGDWLGIPQGERPPNHYALLGLPLFAADADEIEKAARERTRLVRPRSLKYQVETTQLLNEIEEAKLCLRNPVSRTEYDRILKDRLDARSPDTAKADQSDVPLELVWRAAPADPESELDLADVDDSAIERVPRLPARVVGRRRPRPAAQPAPPTGSPGSPRRVVAVVALGSIGALIVTTVLLGDAINSTPDSDAAALSAPIPVAPAPPEIEGGLGGAADAGPMAARPALEPELQKLRRLFQQVEERQQTEQPSEDFVYALLDLSVRARQLLEVHPQDSELQVLAKKLPEAAGLALIANVTSRCQSIDLEEFPEFRAQLAQPPATNLLTDAQRAELVQSVEQAWLERLGVSRRERIAKCIERQDFVAAWALSAAPLPRELQAQGAELERDAELQIQQGLSAYADDVSRRARQLTRDYRFVEAWRRLHNLSEVPGVEGAGLADSIKTSKRTVLLAAQRYLIIVPARRKQSAEQTEALLEIMSGDPEFAVFARECRRSMSDPMQAEAAPRARDDANPNDPVAARKAFLVAKDKKLKTIVIKSERQNFDAWCDALHRKHRHYDGYFVVSTEFMDVTGESLVDAAYQLRSSKPPRGRGAPGWRSEWFRSKAQMLEESATAN